MSKPSVLNFYWTIDANGTTLKEDETLAEYRTAATVYLIRFYFCLCVRQSHSQPSSFLWTFTHTHTHTRKFSLWGSEHVYLPCCELNQVVAWLLAFAERFAESKVRIQRNAQRKFSLSDWLSPNQKRQTVKDYKYVEKIYPLSVFRGSLSTRILRRFEDVFCWFVHWISWLSAILEVGQVDGR